MIRCTWKLVDDDDNVWATDCDNLHQFFDGGPKENHYRYCPYCGKEIVTEVS